MIYDLIILGAGAAGTAAAQLAARKGMRTALLDPNPVGGVCLHTGCIPAKVCLQNTFPDMASLDAHRKSVIETLQAGLEMRLSGVDVLPEKGTLCGKTDVFSVRCGERTLQARAVLLATGSRQRRRGLSPEDIFTATRLPDEAAILGGGAAGLETASYLRRMGKTVTVFEQAERLLPDAEPEISASLLRSLKRKGIIVRLGTDAPPETGTVIFAAGREPVTDGMGLESVGLSGIETNAHMETSVPGLFAAGDVTGRHCTAHAAMREAECAVRNLCGEADAVDYDAVPHALFTDPQTAWVGKTEAAARARGADVRTAVVPLKSVGGYLAGGGDGTGVCKLVADADGTILGVHGCGGAAAEWIAAGVVLVQKKINARDLAQMCFVHPAVSEALREAARMLLEEGERI